MGFIEVYRDPSLCSGLRKEGFGKSSLIPQRHHWIQSCGLHRGINSKEQSHTAGHAQAQKYHAYGNIRGEINKMQQKTDAQRQRYADGSAQACERHGFRDELEADIELAGAYGFTNADLAGALSYAHEHDVHYADSTDQQANGYDTHHQRQNPGHDLTKLLACLLGGADSKIVRHVQRDATTPPQ